MTMDGHISAFGPFSVVEPDSGIAVVVFDSPEEKQNILRAQFLSDANAMLDYVEGHSSITGLVFESGKDESFIAGADVHMLAACTTAEEVTTLSQSGQKLFGRLEALKIPVVAAIHGACLGGGLELALACTMRVCSDGEKTVLGLPEVQLGLLPGSGGTQRLPRLVGVQPALKVMLTGRRLNPRDALRIGLVDDVVPPPILRQVAVENLLLLNGGKGPHRRKGEHPLVHRMTESTPIGRSVLFSQARKQAVERSGGHYPAPLAIIDCVECGIKEGEEEGLRLEAKRFGELSQTTQAKALMGLFFATTDLKSDPGVDEEVDIRDIGSVGVLGAGLMGAGIAYISSAKAGVAVRLKDRDGKSLSNGLKYVSSRIQSSVKRESLSAFAQRVQMERVTPTVDYSGFGKVDLVHEAVFEDLELKRRMVAEVEEVAAPHVIFATNTSSIPVTQIAAYAQRPGNVVGMHYFSPVERMPLLEVVAADGTEKEAVAGAVAWGKRQGKTPIVVRDGPGFYINRILAPYLNEATKLVVEGIEIEFIDQSLHHFGFPLGPLELMDEVGLDVSAKVIPILEAAFGDRMRSTGVVEKLLASGRKGKKTRTGFYSYGKNGRREKPDDDIKHVLDVRTSLSLSENKIQNRCLLLLVNEAVRCLSEGVIRSARDGDVGAVFGIGFPPFLGGPFRYIDQCGPSVVVDRMRALASEHDGRFAPAPQLEDMARSGTFFYD